MLRCKPIPVYLPASVPVSGSPPAADGAACGGSWCAAPEWLAQAYEDASLLSAILMVLNRGLEVGRGAGFTPQKSANATNPTFFPLGELVV